MGSVLIALAISFFGLFAHANDLAITESGGCVILDDGVRCWGNNISNDPQKLGLKLNHPTNIAVNDNTACVEDLGEFKCWDNSKVWQQTMPLDVTLTPQSGRLREDMTLSNFKCRIANNKIECDKNNDWAVEPPQTLYPREIQNFGSSACVLDNEGIKCWGRLWSLQPWASSLKNVKSLWHMSHLEYLDKLCARTPDSVTCTQVEVKKNWAEGPYLQIESREPFARRNEKYSTVYQDFVIEGAQDYQFSYKMKCVKNPSGLDCEINRSTRETYKVEKFKTSFRKPTEYGVGREHVCGLENKKVTCYGDNTYGQLNVPKNLKDVLHLAVGKRHTCAHSKSDVKCWGDNRQGQLEVPAGIKSPLLLRASDDRTCALENGQVRCWGFESAESFSLERFTYIETRQEPYASPASPTQPDLKNPRELYVASDYTCVLDDDGAKCWGKAPFLNWFPSTQKYFKNISSLVLTPTYICLMSDLYDKANQVTCLPGTHWNSKETLVHRSPIKLQDNESFNWYKLGGATFNLKNLDIRLSEFANKAPSIRGWILAGLGSFLAQNAKNCFLSEYEMNNRPECRSEFQNPRGSSVLGARYKALQLIAPLVEATDTPFFKESVIPVYRESIQTLAKNLKKLGVDYNSKAPSTLELKTTLKVFELTLRASVKALRPDDGQIAVELLKTVAMAYVNPNAQTIAQLQGQYVQVRPTFAQLVDAPKAAFLFEMMEASMTDLRKVTP